MNVGIYIWPRALGTLNWLCVS